MPSGLVEDGRRQLQARVRQPHSSANYKFEGELNAHPHGPPCETPRLKSCLSSVPDGRTLKTLIEALYHAYRRPFSLAVRINNESQDNSSLDALFPRGHRIIQLWTAQDDRSRGHLKRVIDGGVTEYWLRAWRFLFTPRGHGRASAGEDRK
jgi:hypothetical protein